VSSVELRSAGRGAFFPATLVMSGLAVLGLATLSGRAVAPAAGLLVVVTVLAAAHRFMLRWEVLVATLLVVVLVIPIKRYEFVVSLPFDLEPYRIVTATLIALWIAALLVDPDVRLRRSALDGPLLFFGLAVIASVALNPESITRFNLVGSFIGTGVGDRVIDFSQVPYLDVSDNVTKELLFLASFYLAFYFIVSVIRTPDAIHVVLKTLVAGAAAVALFAFVERRTGYNVFDHLESWIPLLNFEGGLTESAISRAGRLRVYGPAQHPIALAALFAMTLPSSVYLAYLTRRWIWYASSVFLTLGALATVSRTSITMLIAVAAVFLILRPAAMKRVWLLLLPALVVVHLAIPGTIGGLRQAFFPPEGIVASQTEHGGRISAKRLRPQLDIIKAQPALGQGYGTRVTAGESQNARILDNQWLGTAVETGFVGVLAWVWLFVRFIRRAGGAAKRDVSPRGLLLTALASSVAALAVGMFTFDAFSFIQAVFVLFALFALGSSTLAYHGPWPEASGSRKPPSSSPDRGA